MTYHSEGVAAFGVDVAYAVTELSNIFWRRGARQTNWRLKHIILNETGWQVKEEKGVSTLRVVIVLRTIATILYTPGLVKP